MPEQFLPPLRELLPDSIENNGLWACIPGVGTLLDSLYYSDLTVGWSERSAAVNIAIYVDAGFEIGLPIIPGIKLRIGAAANQLQQINCSAVLSDGIVIRVATAPFAIVFPPEILRRVDSAQPATFTFDAAITVDDTLDFSFEVSRAVDLPECYVGGTQLKLSLTGLALSNPDGEAGVFADAATLTLPPDFDFGAGGPLKLSFDDFFIGKTGISGRVAWDVPAAGQAGAPAWNPSSQTFTGMGTGSLGGALPFSLRQVAIEIVDNVPRAASLTLDVFVPYFEQLIAVEGRLAADGDFEFVLAPPGVAQPAGVAANSSGLLVLRKEGLLELALNGLGLSRKDGVFAVALSGQVTPLFGDVGWPTVAIDRLSIDSKGNVDLAGGWLDLGKQASFDFNGAQIELTKIGFGSEEDGARWIGLSGGLRLTGELPMSGSVEGLRINWRRTDIWIDLKRASLAFTVPDAIDFQGNIEFLDDGARKGFRGGGKLVVIPTSLALAAELVVGRNTQAPPYPFFYIFTDAQLPVGIPLGATGAAIYGFSGLLAVNMEPNRPSGAEWYEGWYRVPEPGITQTSKWRDQKGAFAFGAGVTLGTAADDGYAVNARLLFLLSLPGPVIMLEGQASFLQKRAEVGDPPLHALAVLDGTAGTFDLNVDGRWPFKPEDPMRNVISVVGGAEAHFEFHDPNAWHLYLGERSPAEKRIRAEIFKILEGNSYLMLDSKSLEVGAWIGYDRKWKKGPLKVALSASIEGHAKLSRRPTHLDGHLALEGSARLKAFGLSTGLSVSARVSAESPTPYHVHAEAEVKWDLPRPAKDQKFHFELDWEESATPPKPVPLVQAAVEHLKVSEKWPLVITPTYDPNDDGVVNAGEAPVARAVPEDELPIVPLDGRITLSFARPVKDEALIGLNIPGVSEPERVGDYEFEYALCEVRLERRAKSNASSAWELVGSADGTQVRTDADALWGTWQAIEDSAESDESVPMRTLMLHALSPFEYARETADNSYYESFRERHPDFGWVRVHKPSEVCGGFPDAKGKDGKDQAVAEVHVGEVVIRGALRLTRDPTDTKPALQIEKGGAWIVLPTAVASVRLQCAQPGAAVITFAGFMGSRSVVAEQQVQIGAGETPVVIAAPQFREPFTIVKLTCDVDLRIVQLCFVAWDAQTRHDDETKAATQVADNLPSDLVPLFLPDSFYRVVAVTEARRRRTDSDDWSTTTFEQTSSFQTAGPPGLAEQASAGLSPTEEPPNYPNGGALKDLGAYVVRSPLMDSSTPQYRAYDVAVQFNEAYVDKMYELAGRPLTLKLFDANGREAAAASSALQIAATTAVTAAVAAPTAPQQQAIECSQAATAALTAAQAAPVVSSTLDVGASRTFTLNSADIPKPVGLMAGGASMRLQPSTLYRASIVPMQPTAVLGLNLQGAVISSEFASVGLLQQKLATGGAGGAIVTDGRSAVAIGRVQSQNRVEVPAQAVMTVATASDPSRSVFDWNFVTSSYASFVHHIQSSTGTVWSLAPATPVGDGAALRAAIVANNASTTFGETARLFAVEARPSPDRFAVHVLRSDAGAAIGLMLESPEPLDWSRRVSLVIRMAAGALAAATPGFGPVRLIRSTGPWVELICDDRRDLAGWSLVATTVAGVAIGQFIIPPDTNVQPGDVVRIAAGAGVAVADSERRTLYSNLPLTATSVFELRNASGAVEQRRTFATASSFLSQSAFVQAPDSDGRRLFLFRRTTPLVLAAGTYRLDFTFRRTGNGLAQLSRAGSTVSEDTSLTFSVA